jgi:uncharacterized protein YcbK (DUF882 family)
MKLSYNFTLDELTKSATANRLHIDNTPTEEIVSNLLALCEKILQPIRNEYGEPLVVSSGYRCLKLNKAVGGVSTSQHVKGEAADIHTVSDTVQHNKELFKLIEKMVKDGKIIVGQLIDEYNYNWIHVSLPNSKHKNQILHIK